MADINEIAVAYRQHLARLPKHNTRTDYSKRLAMLERWCSMHGITRVEEIDFLQFLDWVFYDRGASPRTRNNYRTWCRSFCSWLRLTPNPMDDIIAAFRAGSSINDKPYSFSGNNNVPSVTVNASFDSPGKFICYIVGHAHIDMTGYSKAHPDQLYLACPVSACMGIKSNGTSWEPFGTQVSDLPRVVGTKTEDCFNVYGIDTVNKIVRIVRVGADMNDLMETREVACFEYEPSQS